MIDTSKFRIGCISWTCPDWLGSFYPKNTPSREFLNLYSRVFDIVEIDSTFYRLPSNPTVKQWNEKTPEDFLFTAKLPKKVTHDSRLKDVALPLEEFESVIKGLGSKLARVMTQLPPNLKFDKSFNDFGEFLGKTDSNLRYAIEFKDQSWFRSETYDLLKEKKTSLVWSTGKHSEKSTSSQVTTDFLYLCYGSVWRIFQV